MTDGERLFWFVAALVGGAVAVDALTGPPSRRAEKRACRRRGLRHLGASGEPDCEGDVEVKHWTSRPVHAGVIRSEAAKGRREIVSSGGTDFTDGAYAEAERLGILLAER